MTCTGAHYPLHPLVLWNLDYTFYIYYLIKDNLGKKGTSDRLVSLVVKLSKGLIMCPID